MKITMGTDSCHRKSLKRTRDHVEGQQSPDAGNFKGAVESALSLKLKTALQAKIQSQRVAHGLEELKVNFEPKTPEPLTVHERKKEEHRMESNRQSALRCRKKAKMENELNQKILKAEKARNEELLYKCQKLIEEKEKLIENLKNNAGLPLMEIENRLEPIAAISDKNKPLKSAAPDRLTEDQQSVYHLQNSERNTSNSSSPETNKISVIRRHSSHVETAGINRQERGLGSDVVRTGSDVMTGNYVTDSHEWETGSSASSSDSTQLRIVEADSYDNETDIVASEDDANAADIVHLQIIEADSDGTQYDVAEDDDQVVIYIYLGEETAVESSSAETSELVVEAENVMKEQHTYTVL